MFGTRNAITASVSVSPHVFLSKSLIIRSVGLSAGLLAVIVCAVYLFLRVTSEAEYVGAEWKANGRRGGEERKCVCAHVCVCVMEDVKEIGGGNEFLQHHVNH